MLNIVDLAGSEGRYIHSQKYQDEVLQSERKNKTKNIKLAKLQLDNVSPRSGSLMEFGSVYTPSPQKAKNAKNGTNKKNKNVHSRCYSKADSEYNQKQCGGQTITQFSERGS